MKTKKKTTARKPAFKPTPERIKAQLVLAPDRVAEARIARTELEAQVRAPFDRFMQSLVTDKRSALKLQKLAETEQTLRRQNIGAEPLGGKGSDVGDRKYPGDDRRTSAGSDRFSGSRVLNLPIERFGQSEPMTKGDAKIMDGRLGDPDWKHVFEQDYLPSHMRFHFYIQTHPFTPNPTGFINIYQYYRASFPSTHSGMAVARTTVYLHDVMFKPQFSGLFYAPAHGEIEIFVYLYMVDLGTNSIIASQSSTFYFDTIDGVILSKEFFPVNGNVEINTTFKTVKVRNYAAIVSVQCIASARNSFISANIEASVGSVEILF